MAKRWIVGLGAAVAVTAVLGLTSVTMAQAPGGEGAGIVPLISEQLGIEGERGPGGCRGKGMPLALAAETIGISVEELRAELEAGQSVAQVAEANGIALDDLVDALMAPKAERLAARVEAGELSQEEADARLSEMRERVTEKVQQPGLPAGGPERGPRPSPESSDS